MLDQLTEFFLLRPKWLVAAGEALYSVASTLIMLGACANVYTVAVAAINRLGYQVQSRPTLAYLLPDWPTWWIPETLVGFVFVIAVAITGALIAREGRALEQFLNT